jgi:glyoxylase I family protein
VREIPRRLAAGIEITLASRLCRPTTMIVLWWQESGPTVFAPFPESTDYFGRAEQVWMINFRVENLDRMVAQFRAAGIVVVVDPTPFPNGRFARTYDPEGNPIELWEPAGNVVEPT